MELRQLEYFLELCRHRSFSEAARTLYISQQGLSKSIAALEQELGTTLVERDGGGLRLTEEGAYLRAQSRRIVGPVRETQAHFQRLADCPRQTLRLVLTSGTRLLLHESFWDGFSAAFPGIQMQLSNHLAEDCERELLQGEADAAFANLPVDVRKFRVLSLAESPVYAIVPRCNLLSEEKSLSLAQLKGVPLVMTADQYRGFLAATEENWLPRTALTVRYHVPELMAAYAVCQRGEAVGFSFEGLLDMVPDSTVRAVMLEDQNFRWRLGLIARRDSHLSPAASRLWEYAGRWSKSSDQ